MKKTLLFKKNFKIFIMSKFYLNSSKVFLEKFRFVIHTEGMTKCIAKKKSLP